MAVDLKKLTIPTTPTDDFQGQDPRTTRFSAGNTVLGENDNFVINDIGLEIPPTSIRINKVSNDYEWFTLRTRAPQKTKSGHSVARVTINIIFSDVNQINTKLRQIVAGLRATPFCAVYNDYLQNALLGLDANDPLKSRISQQYKGFRPIVLAMTNMAFTTLGHQSYPSCISCTFEFIWFNYFPFTPIWAYKSGPDLDKPGYAWESPLWVAFYQPFLREMLPLSSKNWPHSYQDSSSLLTMGYREFVSVFLGSANNNHLKAGIELAELLKTKKGSEQVFQAFKSTINPDTGLGEEITSSDYLDVVFKKLAKKGVFPAEVAEQIEKARAGEYTKALDPLLSQTISKFTKVRYNNVLGFLASKGGELNNELEALQSIFASKMKESQETRISGMELFKEYQDQDYQKVDHTNLNAILPGGTRDQGGVLVGGTTLLSRVRKHIIGPPNIIDNKAKSDGSIIKSITVNFSNILAMLPMSGYRYPTLQHIGSIDANVHIELNCSNAGAGKIQEHYDRIENMALKFRQIPQGFTNVVLQNDFLALFGLREFLTKEIDAQTIEGQPGRSIIVLSFTEPGIQSKSRLSDPTVNTSTQQETPEKINQEFIRSDLDIRIAIWDVISTHLTQRKGNPISADGESHSLFDKEYYHMVRTGVENSFREKAFAQVVDEARDNYNEFIDTLHKDLFSGGPISLFVLPIFGGINAGRLIKDNLLTGTSLPHFDDLENITNKFDALAAAGNLPKEQDPTWTFIPFITQAKEGVNYRLVSSEAEIRQAGKNLINKTKVAQLNQNNIERGLLAEKFLDEDKARAQIQKELGDFSVKKILQDRMGIRKYVNSQKVLFDRVQGFLLDLPQFKHIKVGVEKLGLGKGLMAYPDFKPQIKSMAAISRPNSNLQDSDLLHYDPDGYLWYPIMDGSLSTADQVNNLIDPDLINQAKIISTRIYDSAQESVGGFFRNTYSKNLREDLWSGPSETLKKLNPSGELAPPYYAGSSSTGSQWQNNLNDDATKHDLGLDSIKKSTVPDMAGKSHANWYHDGAGAGAALSMACPNDINVDTSIGGLWGGAAVSASNPNHPGPQSSISNFPQNHLDPYQSHTKEAQSAADLRQTLSGPQGPQQSIAPSENRKNSPAFLPGKRQGTMLSEAKKIAPIVLREAKAQGVDPALVMAVIEHESGFNNSLPNKTTDTGYMQVSQSNDQKSHTDPVTKRRILDGPPRFNLLDPNVNIKKGIEKLKTNLTSFNNDYQIALQAYNAGTGGMVVWLRAKRKLDSKVPFEKLGKGKNGKLGEQEIINRWGVTVGASQKAPKFNENYATEIIKNIEKWRKFLGDNSFIASDPAARFTEQQANQVAQSKKETAREAKQDSIERDATTTIAGALPLAINQFAESLILGQGQSVMRAYPTFKLYFIEDDSEERQRLAFDDFFSYNSVESIRVIRSRKIVADMCVIRLTNISGILSNRKFRQTVVPDAARNAKGEIVTENSSSMAEGTTEENPMASFLLQEGITIHLRLGYSSDPDNLETVFTGPITSVEFSENEDLIEIVAQSHAIELVQDLKGFEKPDEKTSTGLVGWSFWGFGQDAATGRILEEMLAEPEVLHFGRWFPNASGQTISRDLLTNRWKFLPQPSDDNIFAPPPSADLDLFGSGLIVNNLRYVIYRTTIWDICKEMECRHPNFIASPVYYKDKFGERMTMFFGLPNQLYFARYPTLNEQDPQKKLQAVQNNIQASKKEALKSVGSSYSLGKVGSSSGFIDKNAVTAQFNAENRAIQLQKLALAKKAGFVKPFREYHLLTSAQHILGNNIRTNSRDVANTIVIKYGADIDVEASKTTGNVALKGQEDTFTLKLDSALPAGEIRTQMAQYLNVTHTELAKRYALKLLMENMKDIYKGEIVTIGNPKIKPYDVCYLMDEYSDMVGAIEVEEVQHIFSQQDGFITEIKPDMLVQAAEWSLLSSNEAMGVIMEGVFKKMFGFNPDLGNIGTSTGWSPWVNIVGKGLNVFGGFLTSKIINYTQLAQPVVMSPLMHHGRIFTGGISTRKINQSIWNTVMGNWSPATLEGFPVWLDNWYDGLINTIKVGANSIGGLFSEGGDVFAGSTIDEK